MAGSYTLEVADGNLTGATSNKFTVVPAAASKLVFGTQPGNTTAGMAIPTFTVKVEDIFGNVVTTNASTVTVSLGSGPTGAILGGTLTAEASAASPASRRFTATWRATTP